MVAEQHLEDVDEDAEYHLGSQFSFCILSACQRWSWKAFLCKDAAILFAQRDVFQGLFLLSRRWLSLVRAPLLV